jgi:serine/threonine protein kinase
LFIGKKPISEPTDEAAKCQKILRGLKKESQFPGVVFHDLLTTVPTGQALVLKGQWSRRDVAIKLYLYPDGAFIREKELLESIQSHPNIMPMLTSFESPFEAMIFPLAQNSLCGIVQDRALLVPLAKQYGKQILRGLVHLHSSGIAHLDLKCDNILINHKNVAMITDFGLAARFTGNDLIRSCGTPPFMAPECLLESSSHDMSKVDSYAFGMLFYEMLRGDTPWSELWDAVGGDKDRWLKEMIERVLSGQRPPLDPRWPSSVKEFLQKSWEQESTQRRRSARLLSLIENL